MPSYRSFVCVNCEKYFHVIWPAPLPSHCHPCSKIQIKCPECGEVNELYDYLLNTILQAPEPDLPSVQPLAISPRDPNPDPDAVIKWRQRIFVRRAARFRVMYGN
jgi:hypothetical protein